MSILKGLDIEMLWHLSEEEAVNFLWIFAHVTPTVACFVWTPSSISSIYVSFDI